MIILEGVPVKEVSEQLGVPDGLLYNWKSKHLEDLVAEAPEGAQSPKAMAEELAQVRKELAKQKRMNEILKKNGGLLQQPRVMRYQFIQKNAGVYGVGEMCEIFGI